MGVLSKQRSVVGRIALRATAALVAFGGALAGAPGASAQAPPPIVPDPAPQAPPGAGLMSEILGWLKWTGLWASVAALLIGAISIAVGHFGSNYGAASSGRKWLLGGVACAAMTALAWTFASTVYNSTS